MGGALRSYLDDIAVASFGPSAEAIIGTDDRVQIHNTSAYPWRAHASLLLTAADGSSWIGTAWFIGPRTLVTAGNRELRHPDQPRRVRQPHEVEGLRRAQG